MSSPGGWSRLQTTAGLSRVNRNSPTVGPSPKPSAHHAITVFIFVRQHVGMCWQNRLARLAANLKATGEKKSPYSVELWFNLSLMARTSFFPLFCCIINNSIMNIIPFLRFCLFLFFRIHSWNGDYLVKGCMLPNWSAEKAIYSLTRSGLEHARNFGHQWIFHVYGVLLS